jgi:hypothetical protein
MRSPDAETRSSSRVPSLPPRLNPRLHLLSLLITVAGGQPGWSQEPSAADSFPVIHSMGLPPSIRLYGSLGFGLALRGEGTGALSRGVFGIERDITNPTPGLVAVAGEVWAGSHRERSDAGIRLFLGIPAAGVRAGLDYSARAHRTDLAFAAWQPLRRGGVLLPGAGVRVDWVPARGVVLASIGVPFAQHAGRTRPRRIEVMPLPAPRDVPPIPARPPALQAAIAQLQGTARWVRRFILVRVAPGPPEASRPEIQRLSDRLASSTGESPGPHTASVEIAAYHRRLTGAFELALRARDSLGSLRARLVSDTARRILLDELLLPYDRDLGRIRGPGVLASLGRLADAAFERWVSASPLVAAARVNDARAVFAAVLASAQEAADSGLAEWGDSRLVWLPLQLALRPEDHDTQSELDDLLTRFTGRPFLPGHDLDYATDERFDPALRRSILDARDYHVLWIHDFAGRNSDNRPDSVSEGVVVDGYLAALERAAHAFERSRRVPTFILLLDRYYYGRSRSDRWLELLSDPLGFRFGAHRRLHPAEERADAAQEGLRRAVAASPALQAEVRQRGGRWLRRLFSVHVSVTNPPDPSFRGPALPGARSLPDDLMRDHRKIAFADITEADPSKGVALLTGLGVGESYARYRWLDRTILLRGPAAAVLKEDVRQLLLSQGFRADQIPPVLRPQRASATTGTAPPGWTARLAIAMNATGYGPKAITAAKAGLYTLMPAGSTIVVSDPQWLSRFWGGMLLGSALRGNKVLVIGPGPENAPFSNAFVQRILQRELFLRLLEARDALAGPMAIDGGMLQLGLFRIGLGTYNVAGGVRAVRDGLRRDPFIHQVLPFDRSVWDLFEHADSLLVALGAGAQDTVASYHPRFHLKTQFFGTAAAMHEVVGRPEWREFFVRRIRERLHESPAGTDITLNSLSPLWPYLTSRSAEVRERQGLYLTVGSHNQDSRSLMLDGEAACLVSGEAALVSAGDMLLLSTAGVEWLKSVGELDRVLPAMDAARTSVSRAVENLF